MCGLVSPADRWAAAPLPTCDRSQSEQSQAPAGAGWVPGWPWSCPGTGKRPPRHSLNWGPGCLTQPRGHVLGSSAPIQGQTVHPPDSQMLLGGWVRVPPRARGPGGRGSPPAPPRVPVQRRPKQRGMRVWDRSGPEAAGAGGQGAVLVLASDRAALRPHSPCMDSQGGHFHVLTRWGQRVGACSRRRDRGQQRRALWGSHGVQTRIRRPERPPGLRSSGLCCPLHPPAHLPVSLFGGAVIVTSAPQPYPKAESTISPPHGLGFPWIPDLAPPSGTWSPSTWNWLPGGDKAWATWARSERLAG